MTDSPRINNVKKRQKKKKEMVSDDPPESDSSEEELDLTKECHPIAHYVGDRAEMINQMFSVIKGNKLKAMLPPVLKDIDLEQLKLKCLDQLLGISEKRITCILEGEILDSSSESDVASADSEMESQSEESLDRSEGSSKRKRKRKSDNDSVEERSKHSKLEDENQPPEQGKTLLEILELEMRARAIRALLKQGHDTGNGEGSKGVEDENAIVDLTEEFDEFPVMIKKEPETEQELSFENKIEKSKELKAKKDVEDGKRKKLIAEQELRNKLIKKKTYRTRKQRRENDDIEDVNDVVVKEEPVEEPKEIVIEDPEDGEVSTEEDDVPEMVVKQEEPETATLLVEDIENQKTIDGERIEAIDDGNFIANKNLVYHGENEEGKENSIVNIDLAISNETREVPEQSNSMDIAKDVVENISLARPIEEVTLDEEEEVLLDREGTLDASETSENKETEVVDNQEAEELEELSWRGRWLKNDQVQKVVKSSKMCAKVKKRIASKKMAQVQEVASPDLINSDSNPIPAVMEGSVTEYTSLRKEGEELSKESPESPADLNNSDSNPIPAVMEGSLTEYTSLRKEGEEPSKESPESPADLINSDSNPIPAVVDGSVSEIRRRGEESSNESPEKPATDSEERPTEVIAEEKAAS